MECRTVRRYICTMRLHHEIKDVSHNRGALSDIIHIILYPKVYNSTAHALPYFPSACVLVEQVLMYNGYCHVVLVSCREIFR